MAVAPRVIVLDSTPLSLLVQKIQYAPARRCREWLERVTAAGVLAVVPEVVNYEVRRELLRLGKTTAVSVLATFNAAVPGRFLPLTSASLDLAAELWAQARKRGTPTADPHALDVDVFLAAQALTAGFPPGGFVVATSNVSHLSRFVPAAEWSTI